MKTFWGVVVAVVVAVSLTGCGEVAVSAPVPTSPAGQHRTRVAVEATRTHAPLAPVSVPVEAMPAPEADEADVQEEGPDSTTAPVPAPVVVSEPSVPNAEAMPVAPPTPALTPYEAWLANPTFVCAVGTCPGWLDDDGVPTSCVSN